MHHIDVFQRKFNEESTSGLLMSVDNGTGHPTTIFILRNSDKPTIVSEVHAIKAFILLPLSSRNAAKSVDSF